MIVRGWLWLLRHYPVVAGPLTLWMLFGGGIFLYNYMTANKFELKAAHPIGQILSPMPEYMKTGARSYMMSTAWSEPAPGGRPIVFEGKLWGYENENLEVRAVAGKSILLVHDRQTHQVYEVEFETGSTYEKQLSK